LDGSHVPLDGALPKGPAPAGRRVLLGGKFEAPVTELLAAAKEANKLDDLSQSIEQDKHADQSPLNQRAKLALATAIRSVQEKDPEARAALQRLLPLAKGVPVDAPIDQRWPEFIACQYALNRPALLSETTLLLEVMNENINGGLTQSKTFEGKGDWLRIVRHARGRAQVLSLPPEVQTPFGSDPGLRYWSPVIGVEDWTRAGGLRLPHWTLQNSTIRHYPGHENDLMFFNVPMRGDFEVTCDLTASRWREMRPAYGALRFDLLQTRKEYVIYTLGGGGTHNQKIDPPLPELGDADRFRLVVKDGTYSTFVNDRKLAEEYVGSSTDPWLLFQCLPLATGEIRNLKIIGNPMVPESIDLMALGFDMRGWRGYQQGHYWSHRGDELNDAGTAPALDKNQPVPPRGNQIERTLFYHRPMLEDGVFEYQFYYEKDKTLVHPAFDRLAFMLEPEGVKIHWITDGAYESSGLNIDNLTVEPNNRRGGKLPLNDKAWNKMRLTLKGDVVTLQLNGQDVYERPVESTNQRFFGLFHYNDRSEARVRQASYKGDWPKRLPAGEEIFLRK
jgi:hypothetical protein